MEKDFLQLIKRISDEVERVINNRLKEYDLTLSQGVILKILIEHQNSSEDITLKFLEKTLNVTQATLQGTVARLEKKSLVYLASAEEDKRVKKVFLTESGKAIFPNVKNVIFGMESELLSSLSQNEKENLKSILNTLFNKLYE